ncbi:MFS transporter [Cryobacterium aureum]|uniref:MFS transporter n=1 Tax=Cryobacterium aureum TaxID=995037 RepID=UPI000CF53E6E|nr:MFS transporter [Cryobacterium aureum]
MPVPGDRNGPPGRSAVRAGLLAAALLALELVAGMQAYLLNTVMPVIGTDLDAKDFYGVIVGSAQIAMFLTMPLGPYLLQRFRVDQLLLHLSWLTVIGSIISALAPTVGVFVIGRVASGLGAGALATVSLAAIVSVLPAGWRRAVLAGYNVMWVLASLAGPLYAAWVTSVSSWRWALVLYLPLLIAARIVAARQLRGSMQSGGDRERLTLGSAFVLAGGVALPSLVGLRGLPVSGGIVVGVVGVAAVVVAARRLLPSGTLCARVGRPAALATMGLLTGVYFGAQAIMSIIVQDLLHGTTGQAALVLAGSGMGWAFAGLAASRWPSRSPRAYVRRAAVGGSLIGTGLLVTAVALLVDGTAPRVTVVLVGWSIAGVGMGLTYLDTLNKIVDVPQHVDGVSVPRAATAMILVEAIATAVAATLASAVVGRTVAQSGGTDPAVVVLVLTVMGAASVVWLARRAVATDAAP